MSSIVSWLVGGPPSALNPMDDRYYETSSGFMSRAGVTVSAESARPWPSHGAENRNPLPAVAHVNHMCKPGDMPVMIQVRNVPDELHRELKRRAELRGQTLTDYVDSLLNESLGGVQDG